jgi:hypothetical protein
MYLSSISSIIPEFLRIANSQKKGEGVKSEAFEFIRKHSIASLPIKTLNFFSKKSVY